MSEHVRDRIGALAFGLIWDEMYRVPHAEWGEVPEECRERHRKLGAALCREGIMRALEVVHQAAVTESDSYAGVVLQDLALDIRSIAEQLQERGSNGNRQSDPRVRARDAVPATDVPRAGR